MIEMTIPSSLDDSLAPKGHHVCLFFTQYTPYDLNWNDVSCRHIHSWSDNFVNRFRGLAPCQLSTHGTSSTLIIFQDLREKYANLIFDTVEEYAPGFKASIVGKEVLSPPDLEATFGLTGGNIFHGSMSLDQGRG